MRIGIDIDDTITDTWNYAMPMYEKKFNVPIQVLKTRLPYYYSIEDKYTIDEYFDCVKDINKDLINIVPLRENANTIINKLRSEGNEIFFITARGFRENYYPYESSVKYLEDNNVEYDKVIINAKDKALACKEESIELFIDDSLKHVNAVSELGVPVLLFETNYNKDDKEFRHVTSWNEVYDVIKEMEK